MPTFSSLLSTAAITIASIYVGISYAKRKYLSSMSDSSKEMNARQNLKYRFELNLKDCHFVVESLLPALKDGLFEELNVELMTSQLKQRQDGEADQGVTEAAKKQRRDMWNHLKIISFTRTIASVYLVNLVSAMTCVQLSLLGRSVYLDSCRHPHTENLESDADPVPKTISDEVERNYLTMSWFLLNIGWKDCVHRVQDAVRTVIGDLPLTSPISHSTILEIIASVRKIVEFDVDGATPFKFHEFLLPPDGEEQTVLQYGMYGSKTGSKMITKELQSLLDETRDYLESGELVYTLQCTLNESFQLLADQFRPAFFDSVVIKPISTRAISFEAGDDESPSAIDQASKTFPLAGMLPLITRTAQNVIHGPFPNMYLDIVLNNPSLLAFSSIVYGGWE